MSVAAAVEAFVCPVDHKHGANTTCYTAHKCRCADCRRANTARANANRRAIAYGRYDRRRADVLPVIAHIRHLQTFGYSYQRIADAAGVNSHTIYLANTMQLKFVFGRVARAILAVTPTTDDLPGHALIPVRGAIRRLQALATRGWSIAAIAREMGTTRERLSHWGSRTYILVSNHRALAATYDRLWDAPPPTDGPWDARTIQRTIVRANAAGWAAPLAWDDIDNDPEPQAGEPIDVDEIAIENAIHGHPVELTRAERHIALQALHARRYNDQELAQLLRVSVQTIGRDRKYLRLPANLGTRAERLAAA